MHIATASSPDENRPPQISSFRAWGVALLLFGSMTINFIDRLVLANVAPQLDKELHLSASGYSYIVFAFMTGMTLGQLPAGMFIDWLGARLSLPTIVTGWSVANMLHAFARGISSFFGLRFIMGLFECGNYSTAVKVIGKLFPAEQRAFALALMDSGSLLGSVIAPPVVVYIMLHWGWRSAFFFPSLLGFLWFIPWLRVYRGPAVAEGTRVVERSSEGVVERIRVPTLLRNRKTWGVILIRAFGGPVSQFYWYWLPLYLVRGRGLSLSAMAGLSSLSYLLGGTGIMVGGLASGWMVRRGFGINAARKTVFTIGASAAASAMLVPLAPHIPLAIGLITLAIFGLGFSSCNLTAIITDVFPITTQARITGLSGIGEGVMNMILTLATGTVVDHYSFAPVFVGAGVLPFLSIAALFIFVGHIHRIDFPPSLPAPASE